jgi:hypothetical protein
MCSVVILCRPGHAWPVILAANRDEMANRPWAPPARHWPDRADVVAGLDRLAGGSWLGVNDAGVVAGVMNRMNSLGPEPGRRSRGELVLEALDHADADTAAAALAELDPAAYRPFNLIVADSSDVFWLRNLGLSQGWIERRRIPPGLSMLTAHDLNDSAGSRRIRRYLPLFTAARPPEPDAGDWSEWERLVGGRAFEDGGSATDAMAIATDFGFETVSASLIALPAAGRPDRRPVWRFAAGRPGEHPFELIEL